MNTLTKFWNEQKGKIASLLLAATFLATHTQAQDGKPVHRDAGETYGHTLNLGVGLGYYGYFGQSTPLISANYEIGVARNFTLAPSLGIASFRSNAYRDYAGYHYYYHETVMPIALKGTYYFDELLGAGPNWDFYLGASLGFIYDRVVWDNGYYGPTTVSHANSPVFADLHIGSEYHLNRKLGLFLDLSTGVSTFGLAVHHL